MLAQVVDYAPHIAVNTVDNAQIVVHIVLIFPFGQCITREFVFLKLLDYGVVMFVPLFSLRGRHTVTCLSSPFFEPLIRMYFVFAVGHFQVVHQVHIFNDAHLLFGCSLSSFVVVVESGGQWISSVGVKVEVAGVGIPYTVWCFMMKQQTERFFFVAFVFKPVERNVGNDVGYITWSSQVFAITLEVGVVIVALSDKNIPVIKSCWFGCKVPFTNHCRLVACLLQ